MMVSLRFKIVHTFLHRKLQLPQGNFKMSQHIILTILKVKLFATKT